MTEAELRDFLAKQGLADNGSAFRKLKGGYLNSVWRVDTPDAVPCCQGVCQAHDRHTLSEPSRR